MAKKITLQKAAKLLGIEPMILGKMIQREKLPFGVAVPCKKYFSYLIYEKDVLDYLKDK